VIRIITEAEDMEMKELEMIHNNNIIRGGEFRPSCIPRYTN
jgi:hypothetical protein